MRRISKNKENTILHLRRQGKSIPEIHKEIGVAKTTVQRYVKGISIPTKYLKRLKEKQGGSKARAVALRENVLQEARKKIGSLSSRDKFFLLLGLYWGEGAKKDFSVINSDPLLIQTFVSCLDSLEISRDRLDISLRIHQDISLEKAKKFWIDRVGIPGAQVKSVEVIEGKKKGKLQYGMCRVRVRSGIRERLLIQGAIEILGRECVKG